MNVIALSGKEFTTAIRCSTIFVGFMTRNLAGAPNGTREVVECLDRFIKRMDDEQSHPILMITENEFQCIKLAAGVVSDLFQSQEEVRKHFGDSLDQILHDIKSLLKTLNEDWRSRECPDDAE